MLPYTLKRSWRARSLSLRLNRRGEVIASAPPFVPKFVIDQFILNHQAWILDKKEKLAQKTSPSTGKIKIFGRSYQLIFTYRRELKSGFQIEGEKLFYNSSHYLLQPKKTLSLSPLEEKKLEQFFRRTLSQYLAQSVASWHKKMKIAKPLGQIRVKNQSSRWGSCSSAGNLNFNLQLIHYPPTVIDYVIIHELAHLVHLDHSARFWALVAKHDGAYRQHKKALN